jgi:solute:Na+ symporter, SSS family
MTLLDKSIFILYGIVIIFVGSYLSRTKGKQADSGDYFFAGKSLPWYLVGTSIIAANISAEQFIGMSGSGFAIGLGIATYEWIAAIILIVVAKFFLPVFITNDILTLPQFMQKRFDRRLKIILAVFWVALFVFVNLTSILYLGALTLKTVFGIKLIYAVGGLALFTLIYSITNGLKAIASTDIIQVFFLVAGGFLTTFYAFNALSENQGMLEGIKILFNNYPEKLHMIISRDDPNHIYLPGIRAIFGGIWIAGIYYFGANQYIIQKALGSKNLREAQKGMIFASFLKLLMPLIVVVPGIVAFALHADIAKPDEAYPWLLSNLIPSGIRGLIFAALIAAIISSLSAIVNSTATILTMDIFKEIRQNQLTERQLVITGKISGIIVMIIAAIIAPLLGELDQAFQFIQEFTGMISPGITAILLLGMFWNRTSSNSAIAGLIASLVLSVALKFSLTELAFLDKMLISFFLTTVFIIIYTLIERKNPESIKVLKVNKDMYRTDTIFNVYSLVIILILIVLYVAFW